jgi:cystathionine beta-lyase/cystathionine gamma-synthase
MVLTDIAGVAKIAHAGGAEVSVDNTFLSPALQSPLALGADIVMHSTTKYLNGHSDGLGGALIGSKPEHKERFLLVQKAAGGVMSPFRVLPGAARHQDACRCAVRQHEENGRAVAEFLSTHPKVSKLAYPGLKSHPQYDLAVKQQKGFGSMMSFELKSREEAARFLDGDQDLPQCGVAGRRRVAGLALGDHHAWLGQRGSAPIRWASTRAASGLRSALRTRKT